MFAAVTALLVGWLIGPAVIRFLRRQGSEQPIREDGPQSHLAKNTTPTMGGLLILLSLLSALLLWGNLQSHYFWLMFLTTATFAGIGGVDDYLKIAKQSSKGISVRLKLSLQTLATAAILLYIMQAGLVGDYYDLLIPFTKDWILPIGVVGFCVIGFLSVVGSSNAVNLTDGLDGLAILPAVIIAGGLGVYAYVTGHTVFADYLGLPHIPGTQELVVFTAAFIGAGLSFLWFNAHPAQIFMGDIGSLTIGALLAVMAIIVRQEIVFVIMAGVFVAEAVSVMMQVASYKMTGKRILRMAPLHHHFELRGWTETQVVVRFWIITILLVLVGLVGLKIR